MIDSHNTADSVASMKVCVALDENPFGIFTDKESTVEQAVNEFYTFVSLEDTTLGMETAYVSTFTIHGDCYVQRVTIEGEILYQSTECRVWWVTAPFLLISRAANLPGMIHPMPQLQG